ncbi:MAG: SDR family oxidoreductase [Dehalococcoidales bacterium]|nr:SDR family oxidoreductase [Dehalococcoidales bacterium]
MAFGAIDFTGKVALVTAGGANGGIGHAIAVALARCHADVLVGDIDIEGAKATADEVRALGRRGAAVTCDMGRDVEILRAFEYLDQEFGQVDILVNNAGIGKHEHPEEVNLETWNRIMAVNITGQFLAAREAGRRMIRQGHGGSIVNISSIAGSSALGRGNFVYSISKGAVNQFTRELAVEWAHHGIRVNAIQPAQVMTPAMRNLLANPKFNSDSLHARFLVGIPMNRLGEPEDIAGAAIFLASDLARWITGAILPVDGGNLALNAGGSHTWPSD